MKTETGTKQDRSNGKLEKKNTEKPSDLTIKEWLNQHPPENEIQKDEQGFDHIPIGIVEELLDNFDNWNATDFKYTVSRVGNNSIADASILLTVQYNDKVIKRTGAKTIPVYSSTDNNLSEAAKSICIRNAAKTLGNRFGRSLNNRCVIGEPDAAIDSRQDATGNMIVIQKWKNAEKNGDYATLDELDHQYKNLPIQELKKETV